MSGRRPRPTRAGAATRLAAAGGLFLLAASVRPSPAPAAAPEAVALPRGLEVADAVARVHAGLARCEGLSLDRRDRPGGGGGVELRAMGGDPASPFAGATVEVLAAAGAVPGGGGRGALARVWAPSGEGGAAERRRRLLAWAAARDGPGCPGQSGGGRR